MTDALVMSEWIYTREYWTGDSRDGVIVNGDGYHFFRMQDPGTILEAYEVYETDEGEETVTSMPEMHGVSWISDLGFEDLDVLDVIEESEFVRVKKLAQGQGEL